MTQYAGRQRTFQTEFPDFPAAEMPAIPFGFYDTSWHNDTSPSFTSDQLGLLIWVDYLDPAKREYEGKYHRFSVQSQRNGIECSGPFLNTDSWDEVLAFVAEQQAELEASCDHRDTGRGVCAHCGKVLV